MNSAHGREAPGRTLIFFIGYLNCAAVGRATLGSKSCNPWRRPRGRQCSMLAQAWPSAEPVAAGPRTLLT